MSNAITGAGRGHLLGGVHEREDGVVRREDDADGGLGGEHALDQPHL